MCGVNLQISLSILISAYKNKMATLKAAIESSEIASASPI